MTQRLKQLLSMFLSIALLLPTALPTTAIAEQRSVRLDNHTLTTDQAMTVTNVRIDNVDRPQPGAKLDDTATVTTAEGVTWDIPALWVSDDRSIVTTAEEGHEYLPVLAFFVPQEYALDGGDFTVTLSDSLTELFGTNDIISVYDAQRGITYILPATLRDLFAQNAESERPTSTDIAFPADAAPPATGKANALFPTGEAETKPAERSLVEIYCAQTARDAFSDEDLEWLIDLVLNYLQPQAIELLLHKFPAFTEASVNSELGTSIGMYIYYKQGDMDGVTEHQAATETLAYVQSSIRELDGQPKYCYMFGVDTSSLVLMDANKNPVIDPITGKYTLVHSGVDFESLQNTIVHEMFHAFMGDYNRTGMIGALEPGDALRLFNGTATDEELQLFQMLRYPFWFIEGTASCMENNYNYRHDQFNLLRMKDGKPLDILDARTLITNFMSAKTSDGEYAFFPLPFAEGLQIQTPEGAVDIEPWNARYVSGYLATLYLSDLAYQKAYAGDSAKSVDESGQATFSADKIRTGLDCILRWMHEGQALDKIIRNISTDDNGASAYSSTDDFAAKFILGETAVRNGEEGYTGDRQSIEFVVDFINYMTSIEKALPDGRIPNGSILFGFDKDYSTPLDPTQRSSSPLYQIVDSNTMVPSSVSSDTTVIGAGKTSTNPNDLIELMEELAKLTSDSDALPQAAKTPTATAEKPTSSTTEEKPTTAAATKEPLATADSDTVSAERPVAETNPTNTPKGEAETAVNSTETPTEESSTVSESASTGDAEETQESATVAEYSSAEDATAQEPISTEPATAESPATEQ